MRRIASWADNSYIDSQQILQRSKGRTKSVSSKKVATLPYPGFFFKSNTFSYYTKSVHLHSTDK
jgi:hypothetical protein